MQAPPVITP